MENISTELIAADTMLENGVKVRLRAPFLFRVFGKKTVAMTITQPCLGTLIRISKLYLETGIKNEQLKEIELEEAIGLFSQHGQALTEIVATAILNGYWAGKLFTKPLAAWLRWGTNPKILCWIIAKLLVLSGTEDFMNTIRLVKRLKITEPNLSPKDQGS